MARNGQLLVGRARGVDAGLHGLLRQDRWAVLTGLIGVTAVAWTYLALMAADMGGMAMNTVAVPSMVAWSAADFALMFIMWAVMMVGMMLPSAAPMILLYAAVVRKQRQRGHVLASAGVFASGYLGVWTGFSLFATGMQWALGQAALLSPMMVSTSPYLGGGLLIAAGIYQWTPLKHACLDNCRAPAEFLSRTWRNGTKGAVLMGIHHGVYCVGCCWLLMGLLFVAGVMNLLWVAILTIVVLAEKLLPGGQYLGRGLGLGLIVWGFGLVIAG